VTSLPVIDRERLDKVCMGKPEMAGEFIGMLIEEVTPIIAALPASLSAADNAAVREGAHTVKGIAGNVGAVRLEAAALLLERTAAEGGAREALAEQLDGIAGALAELRSARATLS
jgi:two-component system, sensor histidine kinase and response regulator